MSTTTIFAAVLVVVALVAALAALIHFRRRRTGRLRGQFGDAEYSHAVEKTGDRRHAEADLGQRAARVKSFHLEPLATADRVRFEDSWRNVQARFVDSPAGAVEEADKLMGELMSARGYPVSDFEQRAADISVDHPSLLSNYRTAHDIALRQTQGQSSTEDLRQAMIHYRTLFAKLVGELNAA
jgi:hypothetical protein